MAKKLSKYNRHVQREMKKGKTLSQAAKSWNKGNPKPRKQSKRKPAAKRRSTPKRRTTRRQTAKQETFRFPLLGGLRVRIQNRPRLFRR